MTTKHSIAIAKWTLSLGALAGIVIAYRVWLHVNQTTVALTLVLYILLLGARVGLQFAVVISVVATACYNFYFLPPIGTFTINDPENWLALFSFLTTSVIGSRLSQEARGEAELARARQHELELLFTLGRGLLQTEGASQLIGELPTILQRVTNSSSASVFILEGDQLYQADHSRTTTPNRAHLRQLALGLTDVELTNDGEARIPLHAGVRPRGLVTLTDLQLSEETYRAIGGLVAIALDRAHALEGVARADATRESERLRTLILDSITHELRTPLTAIKGAASALLSNDQVPQSDRRELLTIVDEEADRLNRLVGQAVEMAQLEAQEVHMNLHPVPLASLVDRARQTCGWVFTSHPVHVHLPPLPEVLADAELIVKVLCNLLENAAKYSKEESPIFVSAEQRGGQVLTSVADRGIGIDTSEQSLVFDRLYRSRNQNSWELPGTGMGLAISRAIIESHHGTLTMTSQLGQGSVFTFSLPFAPEA